MTPRCFAQETLLKPEMTGQYFIKQFLSRIISLSQISLDSLDCALTPKLRIDSMTSLSPYSTITVDSTPGISEYTLRQYITENECLTKVVRYVKESSHSDTAHDFSHFARVLSNAALIAQKEGGDLDIIIASALLHDIKNLPKGHPQAKSSSSLSAQHAAKVLIEFGFPKEKIAIVQDAILCHSFTRGLKPKTLEGKILQDADRLDGLGAIGIARVFSVGGSNNRAIYHSEDPFGRTARELDDKMFCVDHYFKKLFKLSDLMQTETGRQLALERIEVMHQYLDVLEREINCPFDAFLRKI
jgi:uncharacterized protein